MSELAPIPKKAGRLGGAGQVAAVVVPLALIAVLAWLLWPDADLPVRQERVVTRIDMLQPPPPPEPELEDPIMEDEEEIVEPNEQPPSETPNEQPNENPSDAPSDTASNQLAGLDRPADAGSDNFRLAAGGGGGMFGRGTGGGGGGQWGAYVEGHIRRALMRDPRTRVAKGSVNVTVVISDAGKFTQASLRNSTGDRELDAAIREVLRNLPPLSVPRPADRSATTHATIDMRRS
ncbi:energy transducer TonB [Altererythrobacter sp. FM1]|uniref:energy transducer TonB family protein n=1 Tax=Tsuneonella flava TaxID=2055955 RepID=UPI000C802EDE|nr:energy transducer TonB [Tsuneonella flava]ROT93432.1 energy transducer TonB [Altererythrobacter sp. FM1]